MSDRLGNDVIRIENLSKSYDGKVLLDRLNLTIPAGAIVGIIGPNGAGKTTLFRLITGMEAPDSGNIDIGKTVKLAYVDQSRDILDDSKSVWTVISNGQDVIKVGKFEMQSRAYVSRFNFKGVDQQKLVKDLSGGERGHQPT